MQRTGIESILPEEKELPCADMGNFLLTHQFTQQVMADAQVRTGIRHAKRDG